MIAHPDPEGAPDPESAPDPDNPDGPLTGLDNPEVKGPLRADRPEPPV